MRKRKFKPFFYVFITFIVLIIASIVYVIISSRAPAFYGDVVYQVSYNEAQTLDIYLPTKSLYDEAPTVIFFHGGAWIAGRKESINFKRFNDAVNQLRDRGYAVISPSYTLAEDNKSPFPNCLQDAFDVVAWVENHADRYNLDTSNVGVFGESAGAHIALMMVFSDPSDFEAQTSSIRLNYAIDVYGPTDLKSLYQMQHTDSLDLIFSKLPSYLQSYMDISPMIFGFDPSLDKNKAKAFMHKYSPINYIKRSEIPVLIIQGAKDQVVPPQQSILLRNKLDSLGNSFRIEFVENADHAFYGASESQKNDIQEWIVNFIISNRNNESVL
jgi:acetyl esterase/lipase